MPSLQSIVEEISRPFQGIYAGIANAELSHPNGNRGLTSGVAPSGMTTPQSGIQTPYGVQTYTGPPGILDHVDPKSIWDEFMDSPVNYDPNVRELGCEIEFAVPDPDGAIRYVYKNANLPEGMISRDGSLLELRMTGYTGVHDQKSLETYNNYIEGLKALVKASENGYPVFMDAVSPLTGESEGMHIRFNADDESDALNVSYAALNYIIWAGLLANEKNPSRFEKFGYTLGDYDSLLSGNYSGYENKKAYVLNIDTETADDPLVEIRGLPVSTDIDLLGAMIELTRAHLACRDNGNYELDSYMLKEGLTQDNWDNMMKYGLNANVTVAQYDESGNIYTETMNLIDEMKLHLKDAKDYMNIETYDLLSARIEELEKLRGNGSQYCESDEAAEFSDYLSGTSAYQSDDSNTMSGDTLPYDAGKLNPVGPTEPYDVTRPTSPLNDVVGIPPDIDYNDLSTGDSSGIFLVYAPPGK